MKKPPLTTWIHTLGGCGGIRTHEANAAEFKSEFKLIAGKFVLILLHGESNPGLVGESDRSLPLDHGG